MPEAYRKMLEIYKMFLEVPKHTLGWIEAASLFIEVVAVIIIVYALIYGSVRYIVTVTQRKLTPRERFNQYKHGLGKALLLSLEILVAADVIRTVALEPSLSKILMLGLLVMIRTFLSWSLILEMDGHWPWQPKPPEE